jgi:hypothetical protein
MTSVVEEGTIFSKVVPQSRHLNSKSGIRSSCSNYSQTLPGLQLLETGFRGVKDEGLDGRCIFQGFSVKLS